MTRALTIALAALLLSSCRTLEQRIIEDQIIGRPAVRARYGM